MAATAREKFESRGGQSGQSPSSDLVYTVTGSDDEDEIITAVKAQAPVTRNVDGQTLVRGDIAREQLGYQLWEATVRYAKSAGGTRPETGDSSYSFEIAGESLHITNSKQTVGRYPGNAPDYKGAIGVTKDSVEGVDIDASVFRFSETHYIADEDVTAAYKGKLFALRGKTNNAAFKGFAAGEVRFLGASGSQRADGEDWEITFQFAALPNMTGLSVGDITGIAKKGWEYLWVRYEDTEDDTAKALVKRPVAVYVERVYDEGNFADLGVDT